MKWLSVSFIIPTLNSSRTLKACLQSIRNQDYPQGKIEILIVDGGSTDKTKKIAQKYRPCFIRGGYKENQEARKGVGLLKAKGELVAYIDSDNILPHPNWLRQMVQPFLDNPGVVGSQSWRYGIKSDFPSFSRYCALLGANDPVAFYLGKSERLSWIEDKWTKTKIIANQKDYLLTKFNENNLPTLGGNGFLARRKILLKSKCQPDEFFHIDVVLDIVRQGHQTFAMVKNEVYHDIATRISGLIKRRMEYFTVYNPAHSQRRYLIFNPRRKGDIFKLALFIFYTLTLVEPILFSLRGFLKKGDFAWFLHPWVCWHFLIAYSLAYLRLSCSRG